MYEYVKKHQPKQLVRELLTMIDPIELITYEIDSEIDINDLSKVYKDLGMTYIDTSELYLLLLLGSTIIFEVKTSIPDIYDSFHNPDIVGRDGINLSRDFQICRQGSNRKYGCIKIHNDYTCGEESEINFVPEIYDQILNDFIMIHDQYKKLLEKQ